MLAEKVPVELGTLRVIVSDASTLGSPSSKAASVNTSDDGEPAVMFNVLGKLLITGPNTELLVPMITAFDATAEVTVITDNVRTITERLLTVPAAAPLNTKRPDDRYWLSAASVPVSSSEDDEALLPVEYVVVETLAETPLPSSSAVKVPDEVERTTVRVTEPLPTALAGNTSGVAEVPTSRTLGN